MGGCRCTWGCRGMRGQGVQDAHRDAQGVGCSRAHHWGDMGWSGVQLGVQAGVECRKGAEWVWGAGQDAG